MDTVALHTRPPAGRRVGYGRIHAAVSRERDPATRQTGFVWTHPDVPAETGAAS